MQLAIDAMNGDFGPRVVVPAALLSLQQHPELSLRLYGEVSVLSRILEAQYTQKNICETLRERLHLCSSAGRLIAQSPAKLLRKDKNVSSSMHAALSAVAKGEAQGCVSAGDSGALLVLAKQYIGLLPQIDRPAIYTAMPTIEQGYSYLLDLGANVDCSARQLVGFARLGAAVVELMNHQKLPRVALLNVGHEAYKGNRLVRETDRLLRETQMANMNYIGFLEGDKLFAGIADVIVCDGFTGNIVLKVSEGLTQNLLQQWQSYIAQQWQDTLKSTVQFERWKALHARYDPVHYNGASLLGLKATVVKSHGRAQIVGFSQAITRAMQEVSDQLPKRLMNLLSNTWADLVP